MDIQKFLLIYGQLISITVIPLTIWLLGIYFQNRTAKRKAKEELFLRLMAERNKRPPTKLWCDALNQIDVIFQSDAKVRGAWRAYYDSLNNKSQHHENQNSFKLDLLSEIANVLGYRDLKQTELDRFYWDQYFNDQTQIKKDLASEKLRVLKEAHIFNFEPNKIEEGKEDANETINADISNNPMRSIKKKKKSK